MTDPLSETEVASLLKSGSGAKSPRPTGAAGGAQRKASELAPDAAEAPKPTTRAPSCEAPRAALLNAPPDRSPRPAMPPVCVQRTACGPDVDGLWPMMDVPSPEIPKMTDAGVAVPRLPIPLNVGAPEGSAPVLTTARSAMPSPFRSPVATATGPGASLMIWPALNVP